MTVRLNACLKGKNLCFNGSYFAERRNAAPASLSAGMFPPGYPVGYVLLMAATARAFPWRRRRRSLKAMFLESVFRAF